uniref:Integrase zinc-binding domain-containing protein n=1 Tax=Anopheles funestus TaxID=62324 RepID=A0A4Y0BFI9_ANOFN
MNDTFSLNPRKHLLELPDFNGDFRMWPQFKMTYLETARKGKFSKLENLNRIRKHLKGDALKSVQGLMLNPDNVDKVFERLNSLYGNPDNIYTSLLNELLAIRYVSLENPSTFMEFANALHNLIDNMTILEQPDYLNDQRLLKDLVSKLPVDIRNKWYLEQLATEEHSRPVKTLKDLAVWLKPTEGLATMLIARQGGYKKKVHHLNSHMSPQKIRHDNRKRCLLCDNDHKTIECRRLTEATVSQRRRLLIEKNICQNCCNFSNHKAINCFLPPQCKFRACRQKHNTLLHQENDNSPETPMRINCHNANGNLFYQIIPITLHNQKTAVSTYALIDPGSSTSLILEEVRKQLGAEGEVKPLTLSWTNGSIQSEPASKVVSLKIQGPNGRSFDVKNLRSVQELDLPMQSIDARTLKRQYKHLNNINLQGYLNAIPTVLLGLPHSFITHAIDSRSGKENEPIAQKSRLGWVNSTDFSNVISKEDLDRAERQLLRKAQWEGYPEEMISLHAKGIIKNDSKIRNLTPQLDDQQIMRSVTRLEKANFLHTETKNPMILPKKHTITNLIVKHYHEKYKHKKTETIIAAIRQRFWIIDLRAVVKNVADKCQKCKNDKARPSPPIMAPLPRCRLAVRQKPFTHTGVDYFGPLNIAIGRRSEKRWGAVFTCLTTRAVHIELATDLSASSFIICLKNMQHRRGKVSHIYSDNGTNFVGANNEMTRLQERCKREKWFNKAEQIQVGDVVTFPDDQRKGKWLKGRVTKVNPSKDNQVRSACVKIGNTEVTRPT